MEGLLENLKLAPLSLAGLLANLVLTALLAALLGLHYRYLGTTLAGRRHYGKVFVFVALTTTLIISIVKSSLALSLGLVGALSIVRFRTPVKEPEELAYLFMSIAIGLGLGADYRIETAVSTLLILALVAVAQWRSRRQDERNLYVEIGLEAVGGGGATALDPVHEILRRHCGVVDLRRMDTSGERVDLTYYVDLPDPAGLAALTCELTAAYAGARVTVVDQQRLPGL